ncbi:hypothetical protein NRIC_29120 [Enterococcus florum]|uniref:Uncharacterized protein n=1 Tax=Enterococcus florum TaxID=2480627 RepID=A0A4P5PF67_9ENTE|nr:hypothetical protein [Enterococcus florum]GCF95021.1 hypothetical protein NRIC_29120 [Enterococcus florum]
MYKICIHDIINRNTFVTELSTIPVVSETIEIDSPQRFYVVRGITKNVPDCQACPHEVDIYVEKINKEYWINCLFEKTQ